MTKKINSLFAALGIALAFSNCSTNDEDCNCGSTRLTLPTIVTNASSEPLLLTWEHAEREFFASLDIGMSVRVGIFDGAGCPEHWAEGVPQTSMWVETDHERITLMGTLPTGEFYRTKVFSNEGYRYLDGYDQTLCLTDSALEALAAEARAAGAQ